MSLSAGTRLGAYEVIAAIGEGGMGQVYRARDTRLNRDVAIKLLPDLFATDPERLGRFAREAQLLAAFNHQNIAQIYGFEEAAARSFLVMELVEGPTLQQVLRDAGALPIDRALPMARQLASALDAAHEKGIVHRDLKPANIKVTDDGTVKVLDFGLAKALQDEAARRDPALSPAMATMTSPALTQMGIILGTAAYMSPEQARGKPVDKRADIWAFGCVLYEMLTGRQPFPGETVTDILGAIVHKEPDWTALPPALPPAVAQLLVRCLQKDLKTRLRDIGDAQLALADPQSASSSVIGLQPPPMIAGRSRAARLVMPLAIIAALAVGLAAGWMLFHTAEGPETRTVSFSWNGPGTAPVTAVAVTRAGDAVIFEADQLYVRAIADETLKPIPGTDGARNLFLSPEGRWIGFYRAGKIKKIAVNGGDALDVCDVDIDTPGAAWSTDGKIFYSPGWNAPLHAVDHNGGTPRSVSTVDTAAGELGHWWPEFLPDENFVLFTIWRAGTGINDAKIGVLDLRTGTHRALIPGSYPKYLRSGHLLFFHAGAYHLAGFDPRAQQITFEPRRVLEGAMPMDPNGTRAKPLSVSADGTIAYLAGSLFPVFQLAWANRNGRVEDLPFPPREIGTAALSPDGRRLAMARVENGSHALSVLDLARGVEEKLPIQGASFSPTWKRDGSAFAFTSMRQGHFDIAVRHLDEPGDHPLITERLDQVPFAWTRDGRQLIVQEYLADGTNVITVADVSKLSARQSIPVPTGYIHDISLSPDDQWIAFDVSADRREVMVQRFPGGGARVKVSTSGGAHVHWSPNGRQLFYRRGNELIGVTYRDDNGRFTIEKEERVLELDRFSLVGIAPDGRFLIARILSGPPRVQVVLNWRPGA
jgi:predicted Ser/Thr protein kinase